MKVILQLIVYIQVNLCMIVMGQGFKSQDDMGVVLKVKFNYYSAVTAAYDWNTVKSNLDYDRPVILSGHDGTTGHM